MPNYALYSALRGTDDWKQRRADEKYNLALQEKMAQRESEKTAKQMQYQEYYHKYMQQLQEMEVLGADQERIKQAELEARQNVVKGVAKYGGDITRFMQGGGVTILENYENQLMNDQRVKQALSNKANYAQILKAKSEGKFVYQAPVRLAVKDPETGKQKIDPKTGEPIFETKMVDASEQIAMHSDGLIDKILFTGAEDDIDVTYEDFWKHKKPKDPNNPYSKDTWVSWRDVYLRLKEKGAGDQQARYKAQKYAEQVNAGMKPWSWYKGDELDMKLKKARLSNEYRKGKLMQKELDAGDYDFVANQNAKLLSGANTSTAIPDKVNEVLDRIMKVTYKDDGAVVLNPKYRMINSNNPNTSYEVGDLGNGRMVKNKSLETIKGNMYQPVKVIYNAEDLDGNIFFDPNLYEQADGTYAMDMLLDIQPFWTNYMNPNYDNIISTNKMQQKYQGKEPVYSLGAWGYLQNQATGRLQPYGQQDAGAGSNW